VWLITKRRTVHYIIMYIRVLLSRSDGLCREAFASFRGLIYIIWSRRIELLYIFCDPCEPRIFPISTCSSIIQTDERDWRLDNSKICVKYLRPSYKVNSFSVLCTHRSGNWGELVTEYGAAAKTKTSEGEKKIKLTWISDTSRSGLKRCVVESTSPILLAAAGLTIYT